MRRLELKAKLGRPELARLEREKPWINSQFIGDRYVIFPEDDRWRVSGGYIDPDEDVEGYYGEELVFTLCKNVVSEPLVRLAWDNLRTGGDHIRNSSRGRSVGRGDPAHQDQEALEKVAGFMDRQGGRFQYCRRTSWTQENQESLDIGMPYVQRVDQVFCCYLPDRHAVQNAAANKAPWYRLPGTSISSITINVNVRTAPHRDTGDYAPGFGVITVMTGRPETPGGGELILPKYAAGIRARNGDVLLINVHELHCNAPFLIDSQPVIKGFDRLAMVFYLRERMQECLCPEDERRRARQRMAEARKRRKTNGGGAHEEGQ
jgi:hypothetical protein